MANHEIPTRVLKAIKRKARDEWPGDPEQAEAVIAEEMNFYHQFASFEFGDAARHKDQIVRHAIELDSWDSWESRLSYLQAEVEAFLELQTSNVEGVPDNIRTAFAEGAAAQHPSSFADQLDQIEREVARYRYVQEVRQTVAPIKRLLIEMERLVGGRCYNPSTRNYGPGGIWESEGRSFRYPLTTIPTDDSKSKHWTVPPDLTESELITGYYQVGRNELAIMRSLVDIVRLIEREYGVDLSDSNRSAGRTKSQV